MLKQVKPSQESFKVETGLKLVDSLQIKQVET